MLSFLKKQSNRTYTENGAVTHATTNSHCLDLFSTIGALRGASDSQVLDRFARAWAENPQLAIKILFFARDVRGGLGERKIFRTILKDLAANHPETVMKNLGNIPEYGRFDDLLSLMDTPCQQAMINLVADGLRQDLVALEAGEGHISLLAKWLPSVNASSAQAAAMGKRIARALGMQEARYRKTLSRLRAKIAILENNLRERDYTFDYSAQPSKAMFKYRKAFQRNDGQRYENFLQRVRSGDATMHTGTLYPYEIVAPCLTGNLSSTERQSLDTTWNALPDYTRGENALVVVDGSGSMYWAGVKPCPAAVAMSLGIYFAERNRGAFAGHFITFSQRPQLVEVQGKDLWERVRFCMTCNQAANTNLQAVFQLILQTAVDNRLPQEQLPRTLYIVSDMEFDSCAVDADVTNFQRAKALFAGHGYQLPQVVFWNVASRSLQQPVTMNEQGVALVSGCNPRLFSMIMDGCLSPYSMMMEVLDSSRYAHITA